jgi:ribosome maturation factor RimP
MWFSTRTKLGQRPHRLVFDVTPRLVRGVVVSETLEVGAYALFLFVWRDVVTKLEQDLIAMFEPTIEDMGFELLGLELAQAGRNSTLRVYIDHENGVNVDNCADVSRQISAILDVEDPITNEYNLEVSSPGIDRPLFKPEHFVKATGEEVRLRTKLPQDGRRNFKGDLTQVNGDMITLNIDGADFMIMLSNVEKANIIAKF